MKSILMVCYGGGHVKIIAPLYQALNTKYDITILALTTAGNYLESLNIPFERFSDFSELLTEDVINFGEKLINGMEPNPLVPRQETLAYHGLSFKDLVLSEGSVDLATEKFSEKGRSAFLPINTLEKIIQSLKPDLVLATNSPRAEKAAFLAAKANGLPTVCVNDNVWINGGAKQLAELGCVDNFCVLSQEVKNELLSEVEMPASNIVVTGTPVFDQLKFAFESRKLHKNRKIVILLADCDLPSSNPLYPGVTADPYLGEKVRLELDRLARKNNWSVIFRPHPNQDYDYKQYRNIKISQKNEALHEVLIKSDVVITAISTVGVEGKVIGKGLVSIEGSIYRAAGSYASLGLATGINDPKELEKAINKELKCRNQDNKPLYEGVSISNIERCIDKLLI